MPYDPDRHGPVRIVGPGFHEQVYRVLAKVPRGRVTTYGDIAGELGSRNVARHVGFALAAVPPERTDVHWHRVVNGSGRLAGRAGGGYSMTQKAALEAEGVQVDPTSGRVRDFRALRFTFD